MIRSAGAVSEEAEDVKRGEFLIGITRPKSLKTDYASSGTRSTTLTDVEGTLGGRLSRQILNCAYAR